MLPNTITSEFKRLPGQYYDEETGLHYNYFRYYDPSLGRYITSDPAGLQSGLNTYGYVLANPLIYFDFYGLVNQSRQARGLNARGPGGRAGVFGCLIGCASFTEGDADAQVSVSASLGGGFMLCSSPEETNSCEVEPVDEERDCGLFDPNCDNNVQPSASITRGGIGAGLIRNDDGSFCILIGPFVSFPIISPSIDVGDYSE
tara:strand:+ start:25007 stop:25612 length:606 start_codon:yes stop_codon:yes gene_type:complete